MGIEKLRLLYIFECIAIGQKCSMKSTFNVWNYHGVDCNE